jgi:hypothetical protein
LDGRQRVESCKPKTVDVGQQRHRAANTVMSLAGKQFVMSGGGSIIGWLANKLLILATQKR